MTEHIQTGDNLFDRVLNMMYERLSDKDKLKLVDIVKYMNECRDSNQICFSQKDKEYLLKSINELKEKENE